MPNLILHFFADCDKLDSKDREYASMTLKSLANHFNLERVKKYGSFQTLPSKMKSKSSLSYSSSSKSSTPVSNVSSSTGISSSSSVPSCRSSKLNPKGSSLKSGRSRCKASVLLDQIPVCKLHKTLIKYGCCHNMMQNVISLDYYEEYPNHHQEPKSTN